MVSYHGVFVDRGLAEFQRYVWYSVSMKAFRTLALHTCLLVLFVDVLSVCSW